MVYVGLDVSKTSTALCIETETEMFLYTYSTLKENNIWVKNTKEHINIRHISYTYGKESDYSKSEIIKLQEFDNITNLIISDINNHVTDKNDVIIGIEGYSYSSSAGPIIDIAEFTSILKLKLMRDFNSLNIHIISPITVKVETCKMSYEPRVELVGKKVIKEVFYNENKSGKNATKFDKWDMLNALLDNSKIDNKLKSMCVLHLETISKNKEVPKPIDDLVDSQWICQIVKRL